MNDKWSPKYKEKALKLRLKGYTHREIESLIDVIPRSTISGWLTLKEKLDKDFSHKAKMAFFKRTEKRP